MMRKGQKSELIIQRIKQPATKLLILPSARTVYIFKNTDKKQLRASYGDFGFSSLHTAWLNTTVGQSG